MSILAAVRQKIKERQGKSFALLAERVDKSAVAPYCINTAEKCQFRRNYGIGSRRCRRARRASSRV